MKTPTYKLEKPIHHIAFIVDGNGRWAKAKHKPRTYGHKVAISRLLEIVKECYRLGINNVSLFLFSTENWNRPEKEIKKLFDYLEGFLHRDVNELLKNNVRLMVSGDYTKLPKKVVTLLDDVIKDSKNNDAHTLNLCLNYGGKDEIIHATNLILQEGLKKVDEETFAKHLYSYPLGPIDLLIRTSGEMRISNFMLYSLAYAELLFPKKYFPDFKINDLYACLDEFNERHRRFGGINDAKN